MRLVLGVAFCWTLAGGRAAALDPLRAPSQYAIDVWETDEGLPQNSVAAIVQTRDGYLWLGTYQGLVRFDGTRFVVFHSGNTPALTSTRIVALAEDREGSLWIGTNGGGLVRYRDGAFTAFTRAAGLPSDSITAILVDRERGLWIGTRDGGLSRFVEGRVQNFSTDEGLSHTSVTSLCQARNGVLWVGTEGGLNQYVDGRFSVYTTRHGLPSDEVWAVYEDSAGSLWIGTYGRGVSRFRNGRFTTLSMRDGLSNDTVFGFWEDRDRSLWMATNGGGLSRYRDGAFDRLTTADGLSDDFVYALHEDREGSLWIGTFGGGLVRLKDVAMVTVTAREGLTREFVYSTFEDSTGTIWLGAVQGTLMRMSGGDVSAVPLPPRLADYDVWTIDEHPQEGLLFGTDGGGVIQLAGGRLVEPSWNRALSSRIVWAITAGRDGSVWIGTGGGGLNRIRDGNVRVWGSGEGLPNAFVRAVFEDSQGRIWIGTDGGGVAILDGDRLRTVTMRDGLSSDFVRTFHEDARGVLWVGTYGGGLNRIEGDAITSYTTRNGLFDDVVFQVVEEGGDLWMSCNRGIFRVARSELEDVARGERAEVTSIAYGRGEGMRSVECSDGSPAGVRTSDGRLLFATSRGLVVVTPSRIPRNRVPPPVVIEEVLVEGQPIAPATRIDPARGRGRIEFHYAGLSLMAPEKVRYRHRLAGFETMWVDSGTARVATYTNLPPGDYRFEVEARNNDGVASPAPAAFAFERVPSFYETYLFYGLCAAAVALLGTGLHLARLRRARHRERELVHLVEERTQQLEAANAQLRQLSFLDPLTGVANRRRFDQQLTMEWRRAYRSGSPLSVVMIDLDFFKTFNDAYGHQEGDRCLQRVAGVLSEVAQRPGDAVARYGGEEFVLLLQGTDEPGALAVAERLRSTVEGLDIAHAQSPQGRVTVSVGVASAIPTSGLEPAALIAAADAALYRAKGDGRNRAAITHLVSRSPQ